MPYSGFSEAQVIAAVLHEELPNVPVPAVYQRVCESQWEMVKRCWSRKAEERPSIIDFYLLF